MKNKKALLGLVLIAALVALVYYIPYLAESNAPLVCINKDGDCAHESYIGTLVGYTPLVLIFGFLLGIGTAYLYFERNVDLPKVEQRQAAMLAALPADERKVVEKLVAEGGRATQSEISRIEGVGKVKAHRIIERLRKRSVLEKEYSGKTNIIRLGKEIRGSLEQ